MRRSVDSTVRLWGLSASPPTVPTKAIATLYGPENAAQLYVAFSPDGNWLASAGADGLICLWEVTGALDGAPPLCVLESHVGKVYSLHFRHDGRLLASSGDDGMIRMWDVADIHRGVSCGQILQVQGPYARMDITGVTGLMQAQITSLQTLGAVKED